MAEAQKKEEGKESVDSILGKIKNIVTGKEKVSVEDETKPEAVEDEEPMELTDVVESEQSAPAEDAGADIGVLEDIANSLKQELSATEAPAAEVKAEEQAKEEEKVVDVLQEIDQSLGQQESAVDATVPQQPVQNEPVLPVEPKKEIAEVNSQNIIENQLAENMAEEKSEKILSEEIAAKSGKAIKSLLNSIPRPDVDSPAFRSATTLEDVVTEMMKPMLKEWLDKNLETIVRDIVEREIKKIIPRE